MSISTPASASTIDSIRQIHGSAVANELIDFEVTVDRLGFKASGWATNANYHVKKTTLLLFINHRSVESSAVKKAIEQTYSAYLPKGGHPFCYLRLDIDPQRVDVNVHPTKREVNFLNEDEIIDSICITIREQLAQVDTSRTFTTQSLLPSSTRTPNSAISNARNAKFQSTQGKPPATPSKPYENNLVRTDPNMRKITSMLPPTKSNSTLESEIASTNGPAYTQSPRDRSDCRLLSIKHLRAAVREEMHAGLTETFASLTYVGLVDPLRRLAAIQSGVKLFLVDYGIASREFFYQLGLADFGNFGSITFDQPLDVRALIKLGVEIEQGQTGNGILDSDLVPDMVTQQLVSRRKMLIEYFNLEISPDGELITMPLLLKGYTPSLAKLPRFLMRLGPCVDWEDEQACFDSFLTELARFYALEQLPPYPVRNDEHATETRAADGAEADMLNGTGKANSDDEETHLKRAEMERVLEHVLFPALRARLVATKLLLQGVVEVADLKGLYRVFERC